MKLPFSKIALLFLGIFVLFSALSPISVQAQTNGLDVTNVFEVNEEGLESGDIVRNSEKGIVRTTFDYDQKVFGVYQPNPLIVFRNVDGTGVPIVRNGTVSVNVTTLNGPIAQGDFITTSGIVGKGQKATRSGYILGTALEAFTGESGTDVQYQARTAKQGQIQVAIRIEYAEIDSARNVNRLFEYLDAALFSSVKNPEQFIRIIRYTGSVFVLIATAIFAYLVFARTVSNGIQAIGRNPLAKNSIQVAIILNIIFSSIVIVLGIIAAFVLLRA